MGGEGVVELFAIAGALIALGVIIQAIRRRPAFIIALLLTTAVSAWMSYPTAELPPGREHNWTNTGFTFFAIFFLAGLVIVPVSVIGWHIKSHWKESKTKNS